tara:strand:- start:35563 stop:35736 length:174 start_codon:yes stop_codon:yes gene_type:complete
MAQVQPLTAHSMGGSSHKNFLQADLSFNIFIGGTASNQVQWFLTNYFAGSLFQSLLK